MPYAVNFNQLCASVHIILFVCVFVCSLITQERLQRLPPDLQGSSGIYLGTKSWSKGLGGWEGWGFDWVGRMASFIVFSESNYEMKHAMLVLLLVLDC